MKDIRKITIYFCTILTICSLYAAQPIQPLFEQEFDLSRFEAVIFTTVIMLPLGIAPIFYGYLLESVSAKKVLISTIYCLGASEIIFAMSSSYISLISLRAFQGFLIPAILTSLMSYISNLVPKDRIQQSIGIYIGITIMGGFFGRLLSGFFSDLFGWRFFFFLLGFLLIANSFFLKKISQDLKSNYTKIKLKEIINVVRIPHNFYIYLAMFFTFFVFQALLNFLPFELSKNQGSFDGGKIGLIYAGYTVGILISFNALKIIKFFKNEINAMLAGIIIYFFAIQLFRIENYFLLFLFMFIFCTGTFIVHSIASGFINKLATRYKAISNGLYISFYYMGGALGSFMPGVIYQYFGWQWFLSTLSVFVFLSFCMFMLLFLKLKSY